VECWEYIWTLPYDIAYSLTPDELRDIHSLFVKLGIIGEYVHSRGKSDVWKCYGPGKIFLRDPSDKKISEFCFLKRHTLVYFIFLSDGGPANIAGSGVTYPSTLLLSTRDVGKQTNRQTYRPVEILHVH